MMLYEFVQEWEHDNLSEKKIKEGLEIILKELKTYNDSVDAEYVADFITFKGEMEISGDYSLNEEMNFVLSEFVEAEANDGFGTEGMDI